MWNLKTKQTKKQIYRNIDQRDARREGVVEWGEKGKGKGNILYKNIVVSLQSDVRLLNLVR